jgi:hypothetical protein
VNFRREGGNVTFTLSSDEFDSLILCLGYAGGAAMERADHHLFRMTLRVANRINEGNPRCAPYALPDADGSADPASSPDAREPGSS